VTAGKLKVRSSAAAFAGVAVLAGLGWSVSATAQASGAPGTAPRSPPARKGDSVPEVVIPDTYGAVVTDVPPERQLTPVEIDTYGVSTIGELIDALKPETQTSQGGGPALMINGRRVASPAEMFRIPVEAILRADVLPEAVALQYGFEPGQKVVNIVLRPRYAAETGEADGGASTEGGGQQGKLDADVVRLRGEQVVNVDVTYQASAKITEAQRRVLQPAPAAPFSLAGNVTSAIPGAEIDPALTALAGRPVTIAGVPAGAALGAPTLADFVPTAGAPTTTDTRADTTLASSTAQVSASGTYSKPVGPGVFSVSAALQSTSREQLQGLPGVSLILSAGDPFSPFAAPVTLDRYSAALGPLTQQADGWNGRLGLGYIARFGNWNINLNGLLTYAANATATDVGVDPAPLQAALDASSPSFNPFAVWPASLVRPLPRNVSSSRSTSLDVDLGANGVLFTLPAGPVFTNVTLNEAAAWQTANTDIAGDATRAATFQNNTSAQISLTLPLTSRARKVAPRVGDLSLTLSPGFDLITGSNAAARLNATLNWTPRPPVSMTLTQSVTQQPPTIAQLRDPAILTPNIPYFDYVTGQSALVTTISGGDPSLHAATVERTDFRINFQPKPGKPLLLWAELSMSRTDNLISALPPVSAELEAAFPDLFIRGAGGQLVEIDTRPLNFDREQQETVSWGFFYSRPLGPQPKPSPGAAPAPGPLSGLVRPPAPTAAGVLQLSLTEQVYLQDQLLIRAGGPLLDKLNGAPGAVPRSQLTAQAGVTLHHLGAHIDASWKSGYFADGASGNPASFLRFSDVALINLKVFDEVGKTPSLVKQWPILSGTRLEANVTNLFDARPRVVNGDGLVPIADQPAFLDPRGRVVTLSLRKVF
jgi:iron complex outermembrane recepter protein